MINKALISKLDNTKALVVFIAILIISLNKIYSQTLQFERYTTKDGLIADEVYNMYQDKKGYLWIFSNYGTLKYNGAKFKPVLKNLPFKESFIFTIYENDQGQKWVANSNAKIFEVRNDSAFIVEGIQNVTDILKSEISEIIKLYVDDSLNIFVITKGCSYKLLKTRKGYHSIKLCKEFTEDSIALSITDVGKEVFVLYNTDLNDRLKYFDKVKSNRYIKVIRNNKGTLIKNSFHNQGLVNISTTIRNLKKYEKSYYFLYSNSFGILDDTNFVSFSKLESFAINFTRDKYGHFWVGCLNGGIYELDSKGNVLNHYLGNTTVNDVLIDHQGGIWATTPGSGLYHCENVRALGFEKPGPFGTSINLIKILNGVVLIANRKGDVLSIVDGKVKNLKNSDNIETYDVEHYQGKLIYSNLTGVKEIGSVKKINGSAGIWPVFFKLHSLSEDTLIGNTRQNIMYVVNDQIRKVLFYNKKIMTFEVNKNTLWIGTNDGIFRISLGFDSPSKMFNGVMLLDTATLYQPEFLRKTLNTNIVKIVKDKKKGLWFCSKGDGLFYVLDEKLKAYNSSNGLPDNIINDLFFMENNHVLLATNSGLYFSKVKPSGDQFDNWKKIYSGAVNACVSRFGKIYIGTSDGLVILEEDEVDTEKEKVFFNLAAIMLDSKEVNATLFDRVKSYQRNLEFEFDLINFTKDKPAIKYELRGTQTEVGYIENSNFRLGQLPPGSYSLTVYADSRTGKLAALNIPFIVEPAFWETTLFFVSCFLLIVLIVSLAGWLIVRSKKKREAIKVKNEQLLIEYKLIALKAQINPHFMSNCLSAIQDLIVNDKTDKATFYVAQFGLMVRQILEFSSKQLISLKEEMELLTIYMELEQLRFENEFAIHINIKEDISLNETFLPPLILNPIVENAIWHGLLPIQTQRKGNLQIGIEIKNNNLILSVEDNGVGRDDKSKELTNNKAKSHGINITQQRLDNLNYLYKRTDSRINYTDLLDENNNRLGTKVVICIPHNLTPLNDHED